MKIKPGVSNTHVKKKPKLNFFAGNYDKINKYLSTINWEVLFSSAKDIDHMYSIFLEIIRLSIDRFVPLSKGHRKSNLPKKIKIKKNKKNN